MNSWIFIYLFCISSDNLILLNFVQIVLALATRSSFSWFLCASPHFFLETRSHYVAQGGLKIAAILLPQSSECWDYRCALPHPAVLCLFHPHTLSCSFCGVVSASLFCGTFIVTPTVFISFLLLS
jgi:hypothetical protein